MTDWTGRCLCGAVRFSCAIDAVIWQGHCHCDSCQRACSAPMVSWFGVRKDAWRWTGSAPKAYASSDHAIRWFCGTCGSQMGYATTKLPNEIHGLAASLDDPEQFTPGAHFYHAARLPWLHLSDPLPRYVDGGKTLEQDV